MLKDVCEYGILFDKNKKQKIKEKKVGPWL